MSMRCKNINCQKDCCKITDLVECNVNEIIGVDRSCNPTTRDLDTVVLDAIQNNPAILKLVIDEDKNGRSGDRSLVASNGSLVFQQLNFRQQLAKGWLIEHRVTVSFSPQTIATTVNKFNNETNLIFSITGGLSKVKIPPGTNVFPGTPTANLCAFISPDITIPNLNPNKRYSFIVNDDIAHSAYNSFAGQSDAGYMNILLLATTKNLYLNRKAFNTYNFTYIDELTSSPYFSYINNVGGLPNGQLSPAIFGNTMTTNSTSIPNPFNPINHNKDYSFFKRTTNNVLVVRILIIEED